jgi:hypothetical protein
MEATQTKGRILGLRLFLEGQEVDVVSAKVRGGLGTPATADISIPAHPSVHSLCPRTLVHLFFFNGGYENNASYKDDRNKYPLGYERDLAHKSPSDYVKMTDPADPESWKLLYVGEAIGYSYAKHGGVRQIVLHCQDITSYWQQAKIYWGRNNTSLHSYKQAVFAGANQVQTSPKSRTDTSNELVNILANKPSSHPKMPGLLGGLVSLLESSTGCYRSSDKRKFRGVNDFISAAEMRLNMTRMVAASYKDRTSEKFLAGSEFRRYFKRVTKSVKSTASIMTIVQLMLQKVYHVWHPILAPPLISGVKGLETQIRVPVGSSLAKGVVAEAEKAAKVSDDEASRILQLGDSRVQREDSKVEGRAMPYEKDARGVFDRVQYDARPGGPGKPRGYFVDWGTHNKVTTVINSKGLGQYDAGGDTGSSSIDGQLDIMGREEAAKIRAKAATSGNPSGVRKQASRVARGFALLAQANRLWAEKIAPTLAKSSAAANAGGGDSTSQTSKKLNSGYNHPNFKQYRALIDAARKCFGRARRRPTTLVTRKIDKNDSLNTMMFHPDIFALPAPKCNVLFPDHIQSISFSRAWMSECTRLWLHGRTKTGRNRKDCYFSPNTSIFSGGVKNDKNNTTRAVKNGHSFLMRHEVFTGINGAIVGLGDNDIFKKLHAAGLSEYKAKLKEDKIKGDADSAERRVHANLYSFAGDTVTTKQAHLEKAANFMFFAARYGSRTMSIQCRFSPQLVIGMPVLVLDPQWDGGGPRVGKASTGEAYVEKLNPIEAAVKTPDAPKSYTYNAIGGPTGTHYAGVIASLTHSINAEGGAVTNIVAVKCRETGESANIFGGTTDTGFKAVRYKQETKKQFISPDAKMGTYYETRKAAGGSGAFLAPMTELTVGTGKTARTVTVAKIGPKAAKEILRHQYKKGRKYVITTLGENPGGAGRDLGGVKAAEVKVEEIWTVPSAQEVNFSFEAMAFPPWFASIYLPGNIGSEFYTPMIGCRSVVDDPVVGFSDGKEPKTTKFVDLDDSAKKLDLVKITLTSAEGSPILTDIAVPSDLLEQKNTTHEAAKGLAELWMAFKETGVDTEVFVDTYTSRKYASLIEVLGNQNKYLVQKQNHHDKAVWDSYGETKAKEGFHGFAYGEYKNHEKLPGESLTLGKYAPKAFADGKEELKKVSPLTDTRSIKYGAVKVYRMGLRNTTGGSQWTQAVDSDK